MVPLISSLLCAAFAAATFSVASEDAQLFVFLSAEALSAQKCLKPQWKTVGQRVSKQSKHSVRECMPSGAPVCSLRHNGRRLISAYWFSQLPLPAQMTLFLHGHVLNPFRFNWG